MTQSDLLKSIRQYFWKLNFVEVETPYLNSSLPLEPNLYSFKTTWTHQHQDFYLPCSPEFALKKFLATEKKNCFAISHCFRDLEAEGPDHTPEFLMLEYYEVDKNLNDLMLSLKKLINNYIDIEFTTLTLPQKLPDNEADFNQYFLNEIEPTLPRHGGVFITGYPAFLSPLAQKKYFDAANEANGAQRSKVIRRDVSTGNSFANQIYSAKRFELYINGLEIANGCTENTNSSSIIKAFNQEKDYRLHHQLPLHPIDVSFATNSAKLNLVSGLGLGINRFLKIINTHGSQR